MRILGGAVLAGRVSGDVESNYMFALLARVVCGLAMLVGLISDHNAPENVTLPLEMSAPPVCASVSDADLAADAAATGPDLRRVYRVTAYCDRGTTAAGVPSGVGQCAAPADIPFGSRIYIPELDRTFVVTDRTARRFRQNTVDLFIPSRTECKNFGRKYLECEITLPERAVRYGSPELLSSIPHVTQES